jgi:beta-amylase
LPPWVLSVGNSNPGIFYTDKHGNLNREYISLGADNQAIFGGRTPLQMYTGMDLAFELSITT